MVAFNTDRSQGLVKCAENPAAKLSFDRRPLSFHSAKQNANWSGAKFKKTGFDRWWLSDISPWFGRSDPRTTPPWSLRVRVHGKIYVSQTS